MDHISNEADKMADALMNGVHQNHVSALYAAQQALRWAADPSAFKSPFNMIMGTQEGLKGCSVETRHSLSPDMADLTLDDA